MISIALILSFMRWSQNGYYYIMKDDTHFNMGVSVSPHAAPVSNYDLQDTHSKLTHMLQSNGFCPQLSCDDADCTGVFVATQQPINFPAPGNSPPASPLFECPGADIGFTVTCICIRKHTERHTDTVSRRFCPSQGFPPDAHPIHPIVNRNKCLDVRGNVQSNGTPVQM